MARGVRLPGEAWSPRDWALAQAAKLLDWSRCPGCGQPRWLSHDKDSLWAPQIVECQSCNAIEDLKDKPATQRRVEEHPNAFHFHTEYRGQQAPKKR